VRERRTGAVGTAVGGVLAGLLAVLLPGSTAQAADPRISSTWLPYWSTDVALQRITDNADLFHTVSPFWFRASSCSSIETNAGAGDGGKVDALRSRDIAVVPTITSTMSPGAAIGCFSSDAARQDHVDRILAVARSGAYAGVEFNYEHLALTTDPRVAEQVRAAYSTFAHHACGALHADGKTCVHTVMPRTDDSWSVWRGKLIPAVYDYGVIGAAADRVRVMAYDQHAPGTAPGPIAGWPWAAAIADYTAVHVPAGKGELGIPLYGRDWSGGTRATTVTAPQAAALAAQHRVPVTWDEGQRSPTFGYVAGGVRHTVWFSDARSVAERVGLARSRGLGAAYWVPSQEDPAAWHDVRALSSARFWDTVGGEHQRAAEAVAEAGIALGFSDGSFRPTVPVTRGQMASFLVRALQLPPPSSSSPFRDTAGSTHEEAIVSVAEAEIAGGFPDGTFRPDEAVTRGQMATFLQRGMELEPCRPAPYPDVAGSPHEAAVCAVSARGIAQGFPDGTFRPGQAVSRAQMAVFLTRALGL
jgi:spore germination protein